MQIIVNKSGIEAIRAFLLDNHVHGSDLTEQNIQAWATEAEDKAMNAGYVGFELRAHESIYGRVQVFDLPESGYEVINDAEQE